MKTFTPPAFISDLLGAAADTVRAEHGMDTVCAVGAGRGGLHRLGMDASPPGADQLERCGPLTRYTPAATWAKTGGGFLL